MDYELDLTHSHDHDDDNHHHDTESHIEEQIEQMRSDFVKQLKLDEETLQLVTDLARGKERWNKLIDRRISMLEEIIEWNNESLDPLLEMYGMYLEDNADEMMMQFNMLENRRLLMRDFFITKTLLAKIGADVNSIEKRVKKIEKAILNKNAGEH